VGVKSADTLTLSDELEQSRVELLQLAERVKRLVEKRNERETLVQQFRRATAVPSLVSAGRSKRTFDLCSLCATERTTETVEHVRASSAGSKCDHCGQPAIMWIQLAG
jgi:hypothetical protein